MGEVFLLKSKSCHFCSEFMPVYEHTRKNKKKYKFYTFDVNFQSDEIQNYIPQLNLDTLEGVPMVYLKNNDRVLPIEPIFASEKLTTENASKNFYKSIKNGFRTMADDKYRTYLGGYINYSYKVNKYKTKLKNKGVILKEPDMSDFDKYFFYKKHYLYNI
jgi:hypothetical protein